MGHYWGRVLGYLLLGLGLGLCLPPWFAPDEKVDRVEKPVVFLSAVALTPQALGPACPRGVAHPPAGTIEAFPAVYQAVAEVLSQGPAAGGSMVFSPEVAALAKKLEPELRPAQRGDTTPCFALDGRIYRLRTGIAPGDNRGGLWVVGLEKPAVRLAPELSAEEAAGLPGLAKRLAKLGKLAGQARKVAEYQADKARQEKEPPLADATQRAMRELRNYQAEMETMSRMTPVGRAYYQPWRWDVTPEQWDRLENKLGVVLPGPVFTTGGYLFTGRWDQVMDYVTTSPDWLFNLRMALGASLLLLGLWCMRGAYALGPGVPVSPRWAAVFGDMMYIALIGFGGWVLVDWALGDWLDMGRSFDYALAYTVAMMMAPALLVLAWLQARMAGQSLVVDHEGLTRYGPGGRLFVAWEYVEGLEASEQYIPLLRAGIWIPRRLQTALKVRAGGRGFILMEPNAEGKGAILGALGRYAPERLKEDIQELSDAW